MSIHISKREARDEALRIAIDFMAREYSGQDKWDWECLEPGPDIFSSNYKERKTVVKWNVAVRIIPLDGSIFDSGPMLSVNILTKEACFLCP